jgi:[acyl-carrier-protein] S-malonyltransferase
MAADRQLALIFPGQGCQHVGMGAALYERCPEARAVYQEADDVLGYDLSSLCFEGPEAQLNDTANAQPAIVTTSLALWAALRPRLNGMAAAVGYVAGHSLGEFSALAVAGALTTADAIRLVRRRGLAMRAAGKANPGGMVAIIGLDDDAVRQIAADACGNDGGCWVANYNSPGQVVIAGATPAIERAISLAKACGARRALLLAVSVACHTVYMSQAAEQLNSALESVPFARPWAPVVSNVTASALSEPAEIKAALLRQLTSPVRWVEGIQYLADRGVTGTIEIGPKPVVSGLVARTNEAMRLSGITDPDSLEAFASEVQP